MDSSDNDDRAYAEQPIPGCTDPRFTFALLVDVVDVLARHGYPPPTGRAILELTFGLHDALHARPYDALPPVAY
jgi:hypothetical protein